MRRFREVVRDVDCARAAELVAKWGYPRAIESAEVELGYWYLYGAEVVIWYCWLVEDPGTLLVHLCMDPGVRSRVYPRRFLVGLEILGEALGAERLMFVSADPVRDGDVLGYVERLGWMRESDEVWTLPLGEDEWQTGMRLCGG